MSSINRTAKLRGLIFFSFIFLSTFIFSCKNYVKNSTHAGVSLSSMTNGESLAKKYCQSCHVLPDPSLLDARSWENGVLPQMGPRLGILGVGFKSYPNMRYDRSLDSNFYPKHPVLTPDEWQDIFNYFVAASPDSLPPQKRPHPIKKAANSVYSSNST